MEEVTFRYDVNEIVQVAHRLMWRRRESQALLGLCAIAIVLSVTGILLRWPWTELLWGLLLLATLGPVLLRVITSWVTRRNFHSLKAFEGDFTVRFGDGVIGYVSSAGTSEVRELYKVMDLGDHLVLYLSMGSYAIVPRRACADDAQYMRLKELAVGLCNT